MRDKVLFNFGPHKIQFYVFTGSGSVNTGKYKAENWGEEDESQQDIRYSSSKVIFFFKGKEIKRQDQGFKRNKT